MIHPFPIRQQTPAAGSTQRLADVLGFIGLRRWVRSFGAARRG